MHGSGLAWIYDFTLQAAEARGEDFTTQGTSKMWALRQLVQYCLDHGEQLIVVAERWVMGCIVVVPLLWEPSHEVDGLLLVHGEAGGGWQHGIAAKQQLHLIHGQGTDRCLACCPQVCMSVAGNVVKS